MTVNEQIKILDNKIRSSQAQYDLDRQNSKISALSCGELGKYGYLSGEDLGYKPNVVQKAKFENSPLGRVFNKGLTADEKQEGLLKRLRMNKLDLIRDQVDKQLDLIKDQSNKQLNLIGKISSEKIKPIEFYDRKNKEAVDLAKKNKQCY